MDTIPAELTKHERRKQRFNRARDWYDIREVVSMSQFAELEPLMKQMAEENEPGLSFSMEVAKRQARPYLEDIERKWQNIWVAYRQGEPIGFCVGFINAFDFVPDALGSQTRYIFVLKQYRGTPAAFLLIKEFLLWSKMRGTIREMIDTSMQINLKKFTKMAAKLGFEPAGAYFIKGRPNA